MSNWDGRSHIHVAVMVDIDGTLCSPPENGKRALRPDAKAALKELSIVAHVVLWSIGGRETGERVLEQFPELVPYVSYASGKGDLPCHLIDLTYSIDDGNVVECLRCGNRILVDRYEGGDSSGLLLQAACMIADDIRRNAQ